MIKLKIIAKFSIYILCIYFRILKQALSITRHYWIGLNDKASEGSFRWVNRRRESLTSDLWGNGEPNNVGGSEDCVVISRSNNKAYDLRCRSENIGVCEKTFSA